MQKYLIILHPHFTLPGGAGKVVLEIGTRLSERMQVITIAQQVDVSWTKAYPRVHFVSLNGPITSSFFFWLLLPYWYWRTARVIQHYRTRGEVKLFCNVFPAQWIGFFYKWLHTNVLCVWYCHEPSAFIHVRSWRRAINSPIKRAVATIFQPGFARLDRWLTQRADVIFTNSKFTQESIKHVYQRSSIVARPGITLPHVVFVPLAERKNQIISVGRLTKFKNIPVIIEAFAKMQRKDYELYIIGDGEERQRLMKLIIELQLIDRIHILHEIPDSVLKEYYTNSKIFVSCAKHEPFGMAIIEAMSYGIPVIADNSGGPREIVRDKKTGRLINCSPEQLTTTLNELVQQPGILLAYSEHAKKIAQAQFTWESTVNVIGQFL